MKIQMIFLVSHLKVRNRTPKTKEVIAGGEKKKLRKERKIKKATQDHRAEVYHHEKEETVNHQMVQLKYIELLMETDSEMNINNKELWPKFQVTAEKFNH